MYDVNDLSDRFYRMDLYKNILVGPYSRREFLQIIFKEAKCIWQSGNQNLKEMLPNEDWNYSGNDTYCFKKGYEYPEIFYYTRRFIYYDGYFRIIDPRKYLSEAFKQFQIDYKNYSPSWIKYIPYQYRKDPVPNISVRTGKTIHQRRKSTGLKRIYQLSTDPEYGYLIRKKSLPFGTSHWNFGDFKYREYRKHESWKNQKKRKQWM